jgi:mannitol 2-dehydrogenase
VSGTAPIDRAGYDRSQLRVGIVHIGVGGFHRAHQAMVLDRLMDSGVAMDWAICGVGVLPGDARMRDILQAQDGRYTLVLRHPDGTHEAREIGSIVEYLFAPDDPEAVIERMAAPDVRIVSLTITEGGYSLNQATGEFDPSTPDVVYDLRPESVPRTVFGLVTEALRRRRARAVAPFAVMSCDNIQGNGDVTRRTFSAFARLKDPDLGAWLETAVAFPNSMVDRITPVTTERDLLEIRARFGVSDGWPVVAEPFFQWVLEDNFPNGRPPLEQGGVQLVADVEPYELMKLRLLNASHQGLCYFGRLLGYTYVHEAAQDPLIARFLTRYMDEEATPTLRPVPGIDLPRYRTSLIERFANAEVGDTIARLCADSSDRIPKWLLPVVRHQLAAGRQTPRAAAIVASWARYAEGVDEEGQQIDVVDRSRAQVMASAVRDDAKPISFLRQRDLFGDLAESPQFAADYVWALRSLRRDGARATLVAINNQASPTD